MLQDLIPIIVDLPAEDVHIKPLGDLHIGSRQFSEKIWEEWKKSITPKTRIVIVGDMIDNGIKSSVSSIYEQAMMPSAQKEWLYKELEPLADNIICGVGGNHEKRSKRETDTDPLYDVFCRLKIEERYRPSAAFVFLRVNYNDADRTCGKYRPSYAMLVTHGTGGGMYIGSGANRVERYGSIIEGLDLMVTGHTHKPVSFPSGKLVMDFRNKQIIQRQFTSVVVSSMMDYGGYPLDKMLSPTGRADQEIILSHHGKKVTVIQST